MTIHRWFPTRRGRRLTLALLVAVLAVTAVATRLAATSRPRVGAARGGNPFTQYALPRAGEHAVSGMVTARLVAGPYVYLLVRQDTGAEVWVATLRRFAATQGRVAVRVLARAERFESPRLGRTFVPLLFGTVRPAAALVADRADAMATAGGTPR